jgi:hypothetical protein
MYGFRDDQAEIDVTENNFVNRHVTTKVDHRPLPESNLTLAIPRIVANPKNEYKY